MRSLQVTCETTAGHDNQGTMPVTVTVNGTQRSTLWVEVYSSSRTPSEEPGTQLGRLLQDARLGGEGASTPGRPHLPT